jgi:hypothetical protein
VHSRLPDGHPTRRGRNLADACLAVAADELAAVRVHLAGVVLEAGAALGLQRHGEAIRWD